jgi:hypothetical protein
VPELNIPASVEDGSLSPRLEILSVMAYPGSKDLRENFKVNLISKMSNIKEEWPGLWSEPKEEHIIKMYKPSNMSQKAWEKHIRDFSRTEGKKIIKEYEKKFMQSGGIPALLNSPEYKKVIDQYHLNNYKGFIAGTILFYIWRMAISNVTDGGSVNKAIFFLESIGGEEIQKEFDVPFNYKFIRQAWVDFKPVSHLWAAYGHWIGWNEPQKFSLFHPSGIFGFISLAENFRKFGITHRSRGQKDPILSSKETWFPPKGFKFIEGQCGVPPLTTKELEILGKYRAPVKIV